MPAVRHISRRHDPAGCLIGATGIVFQARVGSRGTQHLEEIHHTYVKNVLLLEIWLIGGLRYVLKYAPDLTKYEARNSNYVLTLIVNEVLSFLMNALYEAF